MLESACMRPHTGSGDFEKYVSVFQKSAALFHSLTKNHPFHNGNKRTAVVVLLTALHRNNRRLKAEVSDDDLYDFALAVTADAFPNENPNRSTDEAVNEIANWLKDKSAPIASATPGMKTTHFISHCKDAGVKYKQGKRGMHCLQKAGGNVSFSINTKHLDGPVVKQFLKRLQLGETAGVGFDEFKDGTSGEREQIYRYMATLKRLAKT